MPHGSSLGVMTGIEELVPRIYRARVVHTQHGPPVEAIAVQGERVLAIGTLRELRDRFPKAEVTDFGTATIVPGFNDAHIHLAMSAEDQLHLDLSHEAVGDMTGLLERVRAEAARIGPDAWVRGSRFDDVKTGKLDRAALDAVTGNVPALVTHVAAHWAVANSAALEAFGYHEDSAPPAGGELGRDAAGRLDGRLVERALMQVAMPAAGAQDSPIRPSTPEQRLLGLRRAVEQWHAAGLTSICDPLVAPEDIVLLQRARDEGLLTLRTGMLLGIDHYAKAHEFGIRGGFGDDWLRYVGVKGFVDGAVGGRTCLLSEPFTGTGDHGLQITDTETLREQIGMVHRDGTPMGVHANGDTAIRLLLDIYGELAETDPRPGLRHRIEHCTLVDQPILDRMRALDVIAVPFAGYPAYHGDALNEWYGPERTGRMFAHRDFLDAGVTVAGSSDYPCGPYQPLLGMQSMVTRRGMDDGAEVGGRQRVSAAEALWIFTVGSARASAEQAYKGLLAPGYLADFVVLDRDPLAVPGEEIAGIGVRATYVGGLPRWER